MRRVVGIDIHRTFGEVVIRENGILRREGRVEMIRTALEGFGRRLGKADEVVIEATGNCMAVSRVLSPYVARVVIANPLQVKAIAHAHVKTDKVDAGIPASLHAAGYLREIWTPDAATELLRRLVARRYQVVRHRTRIKNEVHSILHAHLIPKCPHADLFNRPGREWLARQPLPDDERMAVAPCPGARQARGGSRRPRPRHRRERGRRRSHQPAADHLRRQPDGSGRADGGDRRHRPLRQPPAADQLAQEFGPERGRLRRADVEAEHLAPPLPVDADGDDRRDRDDPAVAVQLEVGGVDPDVGVGVLERPVQEGLHAFVGLGAEAADLALRDAAHTERPHQAVDRAGRDALDVGLLNDRGQRLLRRPPWIEEAREVASLPGPRDAQRHRPGPRIPVAPR